MSNEYTLRNGRTWMILPESEAKARLDANLERTIRWLNQYTPDHAIVSRTLWERRLGEFVRLQIARVVDDNIDSVKRLSRELTRIAAWQGPRMPLLDIELILDPGEVDRFVRHMRRQGANEATVNTIRSVLRNLGRSLTTEAPWEPNPASYQRQLASAPYWPRELRLIDRGVARQATTKRTSDARGLNALGCGAGLDGRWVGRIHGVDVRQTDNAVGVSVPDPNARFVIVRDSYAEELVNLAEAAGEGPLVGIGSTSKNAINRITNRIEIDRGRIRFSPRRARNTFIVAHLNAGTHLEVLRKACGFETFDGFRDLFAFMDPVAAAEADEQLRNA